MYKSGRGRGHGPRRDCGYCGLFGARGDVHRLVCVESQEAPAGNKGHRGNVMLIVRVYCSEERGDDARDGCAAGGAVGWEGHRRGAELVDAARAEAVAARGEDAQGHSGALLQADGARELAVLLVLVLGGLLRCACVVVLRNGLEPALDDAALVGEVALVRRPVVLGLVDVLELLLEQVDLVVVVHRPVSVDGTLRHAGGVVGGGAGVETGGGHDLRDRASKAARHLLAAFLSRTRHAVQVSLLVALLVALHNFEGKKNLSSREKKKL
jgi:hypothetical protein